MKATWRKSCSCFSGPISMAGCPRSPKYRLTRHFRSATPSYFRYTRQVYGSADILVGASRRETDLGRTTARRGIASCWYRPPPVGEVGESLGSVCLLPSQLSVQ
ncbi:unnamed protein product [Nezara viridula]|uniref:Uncharacterized protein n=1 Tax=Nezara viridula TaxID=85310 RepID=A0A9P0H9G5_NEZVI|nr:unnamed protein product [Nezara viridula]